MRRYSSVLLKTSVSALLMVSLGACLGGPKSGGSPAVQFEHQGLDGRVVVHLYEHDEQLFAATDQGLYSKSVTGTWQAEGLGAVEVLAVAFLDEQHFLASVRETEGEAVSSKLVESTDGGDTWQEVTHDFGGDEAETVFALHYGSGNLALYATGTDALAVSYDEGRSWELLAGAWGSFGQPKRVVNRNTATNEIWYGGQNAIEQMVLRRYSLDTGEETLFDAYLLPSPSVIYSIQFHPEDEQVVYASGEGGLLKTVDNGDNWTAPMGDVNYRFYFDIALDPSNHETLYTGGWDKKWETPQPLIFEISKDGGETWTKHRYPDDTIFGGVRSVLATTEDNATVVYLGLYGGGIMKVNVKSK